MKRNPANIFFDKIKNEAPKKNYETNKLKYEHIDEIWNTDLADMIDYKTSSTKGYQFIFVMFNNFSQTLWCTPLKN